MVLELKVVVNLLWMVIAQPARRLGVQEQHFRRFQTRHVHIERTLGDRIVSNEGLVDLEARRGAATLVNELFVRVLSTVRSLLVQFALELGFGGTNLPHLHLGTALSRSFRFLGGLIEHCDHVERSQHAELVQIVRRLLDGSVEVLFGSFQTSLFEVRETAEPHDEYQKATTKDDGREDNREQDDLFGVVVLNHQSWNRKNQLFR